MNRKQEARQMKTPRVSPAGEKRSSSLGDRRVESAKSDERTELTAPAELTDEDADRMVTEALDCELDEPEPFVKVLLFLSDLHEQGRAPELGDSLHRLMTAAYNNSIVHSGNFCEYLDAIRQGRDLIKRARVRISKA